MYARSIKMKLKKIIIGDGDLNTEWHTSCSTNGKNHLRFTSDAIEFIWSFLSDKKNVYSE